MTDVAIIIPSYRSWPLIGTTLAHLCAQDVPSGVAIEIVVVDSSDDGITPEALAQEFPHVRLIHSTDQMFPGAARNRGIDATDAPLIVFIDADAIPAPGWLSQLIALHTGHPEYAGIGGSIDNAHATHPVAQVAHLLEFSGYTSSWPARQARVVPTCNFSIKREALGTARFLESTWGNEDVELVDALNKAGKVIRFEPAIRVEHFSKTDPEALISQQIKLGESTARVRRVHDLPGSWLARIPGAWLLCPAIKTVILWKRALTHEPGAWKLLIFQAPLIARALVAWTAGFRRGLHGPPLERHR